MPPYGSAVGLATLFVSQEITTEILDELAVDDLTRLGLASKSFTSIVTGYRTSKKGKAPVPPLAVVIDLTGSDDDEIGILSFRRSTALLRALPSFKRSGPGLSTTAFVLNTSASASKASPSSSNVAAGPSGLNGTSASGSIGQPTASATSTVNPSTNALATAFSGQPQGPLNLSLPVARTIVANIKLPNLYTRDDPLFVYSWFLDLQLRYNENGRIDVNRLAEAFEQNHPNSATTFKDLNHCHGGPYQFFANLNGVRKEAQAIRLCSPDLFGAAWTVFYAYVPGKTIDRSKVWTQNQDERYLRASSPFFPAANSGFPTNASPGTQDVKIYVLNSVRFQYNTRRHYNGLNPNVIEEILQRFNLVVNLIQANLDNGVNVDNLDIERVMLLRKMSLDRLKLSDFIANDAVEALLKARVKPERRALYKDIDWKSGEDLVEGTKRRLVHGKLVVWLWSSFYLSILSLDQQGCLLRELRRAVLQKAEKRGLDLEVVTGAFDLSYLGFNLPVGSRHPDLKALNDRSLDDLGFLSFSNAALYGKAWKENGYQIPNSDDLVAASLGNGDYVRKIAAAVDQYEKTDR